MWGLAPLLSKQVPHHVRMPGCAVKQELENQVPGPFVLVGTPADPVALAEELVEALEHRRVPGGALSLCERQRVTASGVAIVETTPTAAVPMVVDGVRLEAQDTYRVLKLSRDCCGYI